MERIESQLMAKIAYILTDIDDRDDKLELIQELVGWWAMYQAGALDAEVLGKRLGGEACTQHTPQCFGQV
jgi:hypothetical protein